MLKYGIENLRRLRRIDAMAIKPFTILVGRNSSGKSSYLRSLALISQSLSTPTNGPILWWGDLVDFGSFSDAVSKQGGASEIKFKVGLDKIFVRTFGFYFMNSYYVPANREGRQTDIDLEIGISGFHGQEKSKNSASYLSALNISLPEFGLRAHLTLNAEHVVTDLSINEISYTHLLTEFSPQVEINSFFPRIEYGLYTNRPPYERIRTDDFIVREISKIFRRLSHARTSDNSVSGYVARFLERGVYDKQFHAKEYSRTTSSSYVGLMRKIARSEDEEVHNELLTLTFLHHLPYISLAYASAMRELFKNIYYIGPARVRSERYYRQQDLSVSKISSDGTNFAMFLASLDEEELSEFSESVYNLYNYKVNLKRETGNSHISIVLEENDVATNLVDTGYGLSQILPVLAQIWWSKKKLKTADRAVIAIEQPELHLHPAHQAALADAFLAFSTSESASGESSFLIETHSETMISRFGQLVRQKRIDPDNIQVLVFEDDKEDKATTRIRVASFNEKGALVNWPYGFFSV